MLANTYSSAHHIKYIGTYNLQAGAEPSWGVIPLNTYPERALAAALNSCHMMTFLALATRVKWPVASFTDRTEAHLGKERKGRMCISKIDLNPVVEFDVGFEVSKDDLEAMHTIERTDIALSPIQ